MKPRNVASSTAECTKRVHNLTKMIVPPATCFVLGDNRDEGLDCRSFGPVPIVGITGKVKFRYAPLSRLGSVYLPRQ